MMIPTSENMRCPLSEINFEDEYYEVGKDRWQNPGTLLTPIKTDSGYSFSIILPGNEPSMPAKYALGNKCFTIDKAVVRLEKLKLSKLRGKIKSLDQKFDAKTIDETHFEVQFINEDPSTTQLFGTFIKGRRKQMNLTATPLSQLPKDEVSGEYVLDVKHLRKMNRRNNRK